MNIIQRIPPTQLSRRQIDNQTVQSEYKAGYGLIIVKSKFSNTRNFDELLYQIILNQQEKNTSEQHDF